ncbi:MAG: DUF2155 domain-containing protein [Pseudomonadota bacterium]
MVWGQHGQAATIETDFVKLQTLDKITARTGEIIVAVGEDTQFFNLRILVRSCHRTPPEELPESSAFLQVFDTQSGSRLFSGWMFASTPALNPLQHPLYDIWVVDCFLKGNSPDSTGT